MHLAKGDGPIAVTFAPAATSVPCIHWSMKTLTLLAIMSTLATSAIAADKINFTKDDTLLQVLLRQVGQKVELRLKSGDKISGTVKTVGASCVHIGAITGQEFYDAVVVNEDISALVVRNDGK
jgi:hypothetical protein